MEAVPLRRTAARETALTPGALRCRRKFLRLFPDGFHDPEYVELERDYKWKAHEAWVAALAPERFRAMLARGQYSQVARQASSIESRTNLLFSFEKMALRDAIRSPAGARLFSQGLYDWLHGRGTGEQRFTRWVEAVAQLPRRQTRVLTWPLVTVFGFIAAPSEHIFLKPRVTQAAAREYREDFRYVSRPNWATYADLLSFARRVRRDLQDLQPRDMIDVQSFLWIQGSEEYDD
jgi:hypothetical protein